MDTGTKTVTLILDFKGRELGRWNVDAPLSVGRTAENDIVIDNLSVSRRHAFIEPAQDGCVIRDAGSLNGLQVNGVKVEEAVLNHGDVVTIGKHRLSCRIESAGETADPSLFDPTVMAQGDEVAGTIDNPGRLSEVGGEGDATYTLDRTLMLIGSDEAADVVVTGKGIAPYHAEIEWHDGAYTLRHLEGRRAVKVDGGAVDECVLEDGCSISIGDWTWVFHESVPSNTAG